MGYRVRRIELHEFKEIFNRIEKDFEQEEYAPYDVLYEQLEKGVLKGLVLLRDEEEVAYSICAEVFSNDYILISLLAVYKEFRGSGYGTIFLEALKNMYSNKMGIIVEVEKPEDSTNFQEREIREKRIRFYKRVGFYLIQGIDYCIWDVSMHLMALPQKASRYIINKDIERIVKEIYFELTEGLFTDKVKIKRLNSN